jgi:hypothetical protein
MPNKIRGDAELVADGKRYTMRLTLGALAEIEDGLGIASLGEIGARLKSLATSDIAIIASALLRGGSHNLSTDDVMAMDVELGAIVRAIADAFANAGLTSPANSAPPRESSPAAGDEEDSRGTSPLAGAASSSSASA